MKRFALLFSLCAACITSTDTPTAPEPTVEAKEVACAGDTEYYEWQCDTMIGQWTYVLVGVKELACNGEWSLKGRATTCYVQMMQECGGGDAHCWQDNTCAFPPQRSCEKVPIDPPPCCIGP